MKIILIFLLFFVNSCKEKYNLTSVQELNLFIMKNDTYEFNINATQNQDVKIIILTDIEIKCFINICEFNNFDNFSCFRSQNLTIRNEKENNYYKIEGGYPVVYNETKYIKFSLHSISKDCNAKVKIQVKGITYNLNINQEFTVKGVKKYFPYNFFFEAKNNDIVNSIITIDYTKDINNFLNASLIYYSKGDSRSNQGNRTFFNKYITRDGNKMKIILYFNLTNISQIINYASVKLTIDRDIENMIVKINNNEEKNKNNIEDESSNSLGTVFVIIFIMCIIFIIIIIIIIIRRNKAIKDSDDYYKIQSDQVPNSDISPETEIPFQSINSPLKPGSLY